MASIAAGSHAPLFAPEATTDPTDLLKLNEYIVSCAAALNCQILLDAARPDVGSPLVIRRESADSVEVEHLGLLTQPPWQDICRLFSCFVAVFHFFRFGRKIADVAIEGWGVALFSVPVGGTGTRASDKVRCIRPDPP